MKRIAVGFMVFLVSICTVSEARKKKDSASEISNSSRSLGKKEVGKPADYSRDISFAGKDTFDPDKKRKDVLALVKKGADFFEQQTLIDFLQKINYTNEFEFGDLSLFVFDSKGTCFAQGKSTSALWENCLESKDVYGTFFVKKMIEIARNGGGWVSYDSHDTTRVVYVQLVNKEEKEFIVGSGYYPQTKKDAVIAMVKGAVSTFYRITDNGGKPEEAFSQFSYTGGKFVAGELYIYVIDKEVVIRANGFDPSEIGVSYWDEIDPKGVYYLRQIPQKMENSPRGEGQWFEFEYYNAPEKDYVERVIDKNGKSYFIICGYNPLANQERAVELTQRAKKAVKERGLGTVVGVINDSSNQEFVYGRMTVFIYGLDGLVVANGERPTLVGKNSMNDRDETGSFYIKELLEKAAKEQKTWMSFLFKRAVVSVYAEIVDVNGKSYVVGASYFPLSKESLAVLLVKSAKTFLASEEEEAAFKLFNDGKGKYVLGDLSIFVYAPDGTCYADSEFPKNTWKNMMHEKDDDGRFYVKTMIDQGIVAPVKVSAKKNGARMITYVEPVKKNGKSFVVGSGYYQ